jgi:hypothetical protein
MASYATLAELKSYVNELSGGVQTSFTAGEDAVLQVFLDEATREIDRQTARTFEASASTTRYFWPEDVVGDTLYLDNDLLTLGTLTNGDSTTITSDYYWLQPDNVTPKAKVKLKSTKAWAFDTDGRIGVTGTWGFSATPPADIKRACKRLAWFYWMKRTATGETSVAGDNVAVTPAEYPADVVSVLRRYRRGTIR